MMHSTETQQVSASLFLPFPLFYLWHACQPMILLSLITFLTTVLEIGEADTVSVKMGFRKKYMVAKYCTFFLGKEPEVFQL